MSDSEDRRWAAEWVGYSVDGNGLIFEDEECIGISVSPPELAEAVRVKAINGDRNHRIDNVLRCWGWHEPMDNIRAVREVVE